MMNCGKAEGDNVEEECGGDEFRVDWSVCKEAEKKRRNEETERKAKSAQGENECILQRQGRV